MIGQAPQAVSRPLWLYEWLRTGQIPGLTVPNLPADGEWR